MSSNSALLPNQEIAVSFPIASDETGLRDAGTNVETAFAPDPVGCRTDDEQPEASEQTLAQAEFSKPAGCRSEEDAQGNAEIADDGVLSVSAHGEPSDQSNDIPQTAAESIKSRRDFERFLRASGFSRPQAKSLAAHGWNGDSDPEDDAISDLAEVIRSQTEEIEKWI